MTNRLRVLWLTPVQFPPVTGDASMTSGGWMEGWRLALERHCPGVELGILSLGAIEHKPFTAGNVAFFSFNQATTSRYREILRNWSHRYRLVDGAPESLQAALASFGPDLIHVHGSESPLGKLAMTSSLPVVISLQGFTTVCQRYMLSGLTWMDVMRDFARPSFYRGYGYVHSYLTMRNRAALERQILGNCKYVLGNTDWDREMAKLLAPSAVYYHANRAVRPEFYGHEWHCAPSRKPVIYCTSSSAPYKGLETLLAATAVLRSDGLPDLEVRIAGDVVYARHWSVLSRIIERHHMEDCVVLLGKIHASQMVSELLSAAVFVQPSHVENESNALIEAMLVGTPCIAARVGGIPSIMRDEVDGLLYQDGDAVALANAIRRLVFDRNLAASLAATGRAEAHQRHRYDAVAEQLLSVYMDIVRREGRVSEPAGGSMWIQPAVAFNVVDNARDMSGRISGSHCSSVQPAAPPLPERPLDLGQARFAGTPGAPKRRQLDCARESAPVALRARRRYRSCESWY